MRLIRRRNALGVAVVAAVAFAAACGGGGDSDGSSPASTEDFLAEVDMVCADSREQLNAIEEPQSEDEFLPALQAALPIQQQQAEDLRATTPPEELESQYNEALGLIDAQVAVVEQSVDSLEAGEDPNEVVVEFTEGIERNEERLDEIAADIGLTECGADAGDDGPSDDDTPRDGTLTDGGDPDDIPTVSTEDSDDTDAAPGQTGDIRQYLTDVGAASQALVSFGEILQNASSPAELESSADEAQAQLDEFDEAVAMLDGYTLDDAELEEQRAGIVETAPEVSDTLRRFTDAAAAGDLEAVTELIPEVTTALTNFQQAAAGNP